MVSILQVFSVSVPCLERPARPAHAYDAFEAAQRAVRQLPTPAPVVVSCRCHAAARELPAYVRGGAFASASGYVFQAKSVAFHFLAGERDGVACVEVLIPGRRCISVSYRINAEGVVAGLTTDGATQLLLHVKGKTSVQDFSEHLATLAERAFTAGDLMLARTTIASRSVAAPTAVTHTPDVYAGMIPG